MWVLARGENILKLGQKEVWVSVWVRWPDVYMGIGMSSESEWVVCVKGYRCERMTCVNGRLGEKRRRTFTLQIFFVKD